MTKTIELDKYSGGVGVLAGRERGEYVRQQEKLDEADERGTKVCIVIPDYVFSVNSSFFLGMLEKSVKNLGELRFRERYSFVGPNAERTLEEGIRKAQLMGTRLRPLRRATA